MTDADHCEHGWTWGQCCPKPWPSADRTAFTHGMELLDDPAILVAMTPRPADEVVIDGKRWRVIPTGFGYDDGSQSCRLVPTEVAQDQVDWRVMALRVKHENAGPECFCENPKPGAHAQSCPRFGLNP